MNISYKLWCCIYAEQWFERLCINEYNARRIKVYFYVLINRQSKQCMRSQKYPRIELYYLHFVYGICMINQRLIGYGLY